MKNRYIVNEVITEYLDSRYIPLSEDLQEFRAQAEADGVPVILRDTERLLDVLINIVKPHKILEFGTAVGYSACFFAESLKRAEVGEFSVTSLESDEVVYLKAVDNINKFGLGDRVNLILGDAARTADNLQGEFDFVFIDAAKSHYRTYFDLSLKKSHTGTLIV